jgi:hypothetical protein
LIYFGLEAIENEEIAVVSGSIPGKPIVKTNRSEQGSSSRKSLFDVHLKKVCK